MGDLGKIKGKTFVVTGGASGLGAKYVHEFLKHGAKAVAILDISEQVGKATAERLEKEYPNKVVFIKCDVSDEKNNSEAFEAVVEKFKQIDCIVNNAGLMNDSLNVLLKMCDVNWRGLVSLTTKAIEHMRKDKGGAGGTIVNVSSVLGLLTSRHQPVYAGGTKIAVLHFSQSVATPPFFEETGIRILTICYGPTDTPLLHNLEKLTYVSAPGHELTDYVTKHNVLYQKVDTAVQGFLDMYANAQPGTVWVGSDNKPIRDVTNDLNKVYEMMMKIVFDQPI